MFSDLLGYSVNGLKRRVLRSLLTITGIVIGITAIFVLLSLGQGISDSVNSQLDSFGSKTVIVIPGKMSGGGGGAGLPPSSGKLYEKDVERLKRLDEIGIITPVIMSRVSVQYKNKSAQVSVTGIEPKNYRDSASGIDVVQGRFIEDNDKLSLVIGQKVAKESFHKEELMVGSVVYAQGRPFRVVGLLAPKGDSAFDSTDSTVYATIDDMRDLLKSTLAPHEISAIYIELKDGVDNKEAEENIRFQLRASHKVKEDNEDFSLLTQEFIKERIGMITGMLTIFLGGLACISLLVGGVTVANTMFAAVLERYKEIGTLKAIGAKNSHIFVIFLIEAVILSVAGGIAGCIIATLLLFAISFAVQLLFGTTVPFWLSWQLYSGALLFSLVVGVLSGFFPARRAASLTPVKALSYNG